jgi:endonuclease/exonuclease/phosphatase family metal-dependent hydrolase
MRIVTYNTHGSAGMDGVRSTQRIAETVRPYSADVICFQEIYERIPPPLEDQPARLASLLNRRFTMQRCLDFAFGGYGNGIAASTAGETFRHILPSGKEQRGALEIRLRNIGGLASLSVFCTHWGLDESERILQAEALANLVLAAPRPVVVAGDLNETPGGPAVVDLLARTGLLDASAGFYRPTFIANNPTVQLDYILHSPDLRVSSFEVIRSEASDHLPVMADLVPSTLPAPAR